MTISDWIFIAFFVLGVAALNYLKMISKQIESLRHEVKDLRFAVQHGLFEDSGTPLLGGLRDELSGVASDLNGIVNPLPLPSEP